MNLPPKQLQTYRAVQSFPDGAPLREIAKVAKLTTGQSGWHLKELTDMKLTAYAGPKRSRLSRWCLAADLERVTKIVEADQIASSRAARKHRRELNKIAQRLRGHVEGDPDDKPFVHRWIDAKSAPPIRPAGPVWVFDCHV